MQTIVLILTTGVLTPSLYSKTHAECPEWYLWVYETARREGRDISAKWDVEDVFNSKADCDKEKPKRLLGKRESMGCAFNRECFTFHDVVKRLFKKDGVVYDHQAL